eukprot:TRINITY_DN22286_c0_g1_i1.p1 TRINITY_DN22286_c0_g1~~TRINITY_DN22286_c0_g1_i1.p1  ORF type:complete len:554 (+),score=68.56 TRINITY_DN22286_c0_g1_i1:56-1717(+)
MLLSYFRRSCSSSPKKFNFSKRVSTQSDAGKNHFRLHNHANVRVISTTSREKPKIAQSGTPSKVSVKAVVEEGGSNSIYHFRAPNQKVASPIKEPVTDMQLSVVNNSGYASALQNYNFHRRISLLLDEDDCPHPHQVYKDVISTYEDCTLTACDYTVLMAHCHVLLRCMESLEVPTESGLQVESSKPGELSLAYTEESQKQRSAYNKCYADTLDLWWALKERSARKHEQIPMKAYSSAIRCCATLEDANTAQEIFESHPDRLARYRNISLMSSLMWVFAEKGQMSKCVKLYDEIKEARLMLTTDTYEALLHCAFKINEINTVLRIWRFIEKDRNVEPSPSTWEMTVIGCLDTGFRHHAFLFYDKYKDSGCFPSEYVQKRMTEQYSLSVTENLQPGSKIANAVSRGAHLSYKMIIDFARVKSLRDVTLPDHVPAMHSHYYAPIDGAGRGMDVDYHHMLPETRRGSIPIYTTHADPHYIRSGATVFAPPGHRKVLRKETVGRAARRLRRASDFASFEYQTGTLRKKGKDIHDYLGNRGKGPMTSESFTMGFNKRL